jgi:hypothetical protein
VTARPRDSFHVPGSGAAGTDWSVWAGVEAAVMAFSGDGISE